VAAFKIAVLAVGVALWLELAWAVERASGTGMRWPSSPANKIPGRSPSPRCSH
jgi:hypothetical protein